jgi:hypothetical protein
MDFTFTESECELGLLGTLVPEKWGGSAVSEVLEIARELGC